jgi:hypothetical protein
MDIDHLNDFDLFDKLLSASVNRFHNIHSPNNTEDPLVWYGAEGGIIPGRSQEESILVQNILIRWTYPHLMMYWSQLAEYIDQVVQVKITNEVIGSYSDGSRTVFALHRPMLEEFAHAILALHQILFAASEFVHSSHIYGFKIDEEFRFLCMLAHNPSCSELHLTFGVLQKHASMAATHIRNHLITFGKMFRTLDDNTSLLSVNSTRLSL